MGRGRACVAQVAHVRPPRQTCVPLPAQAILENVIFVHQEDSNWPLAEGKVGLHCRQRPTGLPADLLCKHSLVRAAALHTCIPC